MVRQYLQHIRVEIARLVAWVIFREPVKLTVGRHEVWLDPASGRLIPAAAGGDGTDDKDDPDDDADADDKDADADADKADADDKDAAPGADVDKDDDGEFGRDIEATKRESRKHERRAKKAEERAAAAEAKLKDIEGKNKSAQEKALEAARDEARAEVKAEYEKSRRSDRLEGAVLRLAAKGVKVGDGDDAQIVRFDDPEDALVFIERAIAREDIDADDIYDEDGKVQTDALTSELVDLLERKPKLAAGSDDDGDSGRSRRKVKGSSDAGKGSGGKDVEDMDPDDHLKALQGR
jgi:hypothetical protein